MGSTLLAVLPGMEFAPLAAAENGATTAEVAAAQSEIVNWFILVLVVGALTFAAGVFLFAAAIWTTRVAGAGLTTVVVAALVVMAVTRSSHSPSPSSMRKARQPWSRCGRWPTSCGPGPYRWPDLRPP